MFLAVENHCGTTQGMDIKKVTKIPPFKIINHYLDLCELSRTNSNNSEREIISKNITKAHKAKKKKAVAQKAM